MHLDDEESAPTRVRPHSHLTQGVFTSRRTSLPLPTTTAALAPSAPASPPQRVQATLPQRARAQTKARVVQEIFTTPTRPACDRAVSVQPNHPKLRAATSHRSNSLPMACQPAASVPLRTTNMNIPSLQEAMPRPESTPVQSSLTQSPVQLEPSIVNTRPDSQGTPSTLSPRAHEPVFKRHPHKERTKPQVIRTLFTSSTVPNIAGAKMPRRRRSKPRVVQAIFTTSTVSDVDTSTSLQPISSEGSSARIVPTSSNPDHNASMASASKPQQQVVLVDPSCVEEPSNATRTGLAANGVPTKPRVVQSILTTPTVPNVDSSTTAKPLHSGVDHLGSQDASSNEKSTLPRKSEAPESARPAAKPRKPRAVQAIFTSPTVPLTKDPAAKVSAVHGGHLGGQSSTPMVSNLETQVQGIESCSTNPACDGDERKRDECGVVSVSTDHVPEATPLTMETLGRFHVTEIEIPVDESKRNRKHQRSQTERVVTAGRFEICDLPATDDNAESRHSAGKNSFDLPSIREWLRHCDRILAERHHRAVDVEPAGAAGIRRIKTIGWPFKADATQAPKVTDSIRRMSLSRSSMSSVNLTRMRLEQADEEATSATNFLSRTVCEFHRGSKTPSSCLSSCEATKESSPKFPIAVRESADVLTKQPVAPPKSPDPARRGRFEVKDITHQLHAKPDGLQESPNTPNQSWQPRLGRSSQSASDIKVQVLRGCQFQLDSSADDDPKENCVPTKAFNNPLLALQGLTRYIVEIGKERDALRRENHVLRQENERFRYTLHLYEQKQPSS